MKKHLTKNNLLTLVALIAFAFGIYFGVSKSYEPSKWAFIAGIASLLFANLDRFKRFKVDKSGVEAETREVVREARSTIKELQNLSKIMASITLGLIKRAGRYGGGYSYDEKESVKESVLNVLQQIGVSDEECERIVTESKWHKYVEFDYVHHILGGNRIPGFLPGDKLAERKNLKERGLHNLPTPEELTKFFEQCELLSAEVKELIEDYRHYIKFRRQRRPDIWNNRASWSHFQKKDK